MVFDPFQQYDINQQEVTLHDLVLRETKKEAFKKFDGDKLDLTLAPTCLTKHYCSIAMMGAKKYGRDNWKKAKVEDVVRYYAAMLRHQMAEIDGQVNDPESGLPHGWHSLWNRTAINYFVDKFGYNEVFKHIRGSND